MRKLWYAGAVVASGFVLVGASPAQADLLPGTGTAEQQADERLADLLGQSNGIDLENPLRYSTLGDTPVGSQPVMQFKAGPNSPDVRPLLPGREPGEQRPELPAAQVVGGALRQGPDAGNLNVQQLPLRSLLSGLPLFGGLLPDGGRPSALQRPTLRQAEAFDGGMPLLGGLGGLLPVNDLPRTAQAGTKPDLSGLPAGGVAVLPAAAPGQTAPAQPNPGQTAPVAQQPATAEQPAADQPAPAQPAKPAKPANKPQPAETPEDPRLHEEPIDGEASHREFSPDGRPIAGIDQDYK